MEDAATAPLTRRHVNGVSLSECAPTTDSGFTPMIFVHGGCHGSWQFEETQREFAKMGRSSIALDWLNHGESDELPREEWVRRGIESVVREIGVAVDESPGKPVLFGHSMGGMASTLYACANPDKIAALVLGAPVIPKKFAGPPLDMPVDLDVPWGPPPPELARQLFYDTVDDQRAAEIYPLLQSESPRAVTQAEKWTIDADIESLTLPILVLTGENDILTPSEYIIGMAKAIGADHISMDATGHGIIFDRRWPDFCRQIHTWLTGVLENERPSS
jgi:pimeloyl-ACP methyl ester carboxylesterase